MSQWTTDPTTLELEHKFYAWLTQPGILSVALRRVCTALSVQVVQQGLTTAASTEQEILNALENTSWIRATYLCGDKTPLVATRTVVSFATYSKFKVALDKLGDQLLGEAFLYQQPDVTRSPFEYAIVNDRPTRRSILHAAGASFLIAESFLQAIPVLV